jgi:hypothetical protein
VAQEFLERADVVSGEDVPVGCQVGDEGVDVALAERPGVPAAVELDEAACPKNVGLLGSPAQLAGAGCQPQSLQQTGTRGALGDHGDDWCAWGPARGRSPWARRSRRGCAVALAAVAAGEGEVSRPAGTGG